MCTPRIHNHRQDTVHLSILRACVPCRQSKVPLGALLSSFLLFSCWVVFPCWVYHIVYHFPIDGYLECLQFFPIMSAMTIHIKVV